MSPNHMKGTIPIRLGKQPSSLWDLAAFYTNMIVSLVK